MFIRKTNKCVIHSRQLGNGLRQINVLAQDKLLVPLDKTLWLRGGRCLLGQQGGKEVGGLHKVGLVVLIEAVDVEHGEGGGGPRVATRSGQVEDSSVVQLLETQNMSLLNI